ncbi:hypothetical protein SAMN02745170_00363 [Propionispora hippei DSM 15287]|uniref:Uncharacterized protein n=1 Tax=Propionispora hippei DSM 15287 TaxID=1123003 RepID=A0A1M6B1V4_9FIRM|nr:hypothetical protein SAMN02745170_00363 [Propionispora hippei DSM 15287]
MVFINLAAMILFIIFAKIPNGRLKSIIRDIIFELDKLADTMENCQKREAAIQQITSILSWRSIMIPSALIGWIIDTEVAAIRKMQQTTQTPDLHEPDKKSANDC